MSELVFPKAQKPLAVALAGGGIGGLTAALCLARAGHAVTVYEQADTFLESGAGVQISPNASRVLHALDLTHALDEVGCLPEATEIRSWRSGRVISHTPLGYAARKRYGAPYYHVHRGDLLQLLVAQARDQSSIELVLGKRVGAFTEDSAGVLIDLGDDSRTFDLLIGADGIHSSVREQLWGEHGADFTGNMAWRLLVAVDQLPEGLIAPNATVWWGPGKHFVHYLVNGGRQVNCVCVVETNAWHPESWIESGSLAELQADVAGWHDSIQALLACADESSLFKWGLFDRAPMPRWGQGRVSLLGDACHPTLPFMAQGAAMAIEDAAVLARCLSAGSETGSETDSATALQRYEDLRRQRTADVQRGSRRIATIFHLTGIKAWLRDRAAAQAGVRTMDKLYRYDPLSVGLNGNVES
ncbi:MAG: FAD-dependent monooxygenase [Pseudomonadales bacterium]|nr:FAD-dependent monooxygenase [Pseudomonadales bacterium]